MPYLTDADLAAMKARADAAQEGPWFMAHNFDRAMALVLHDSGQEADGRIAYCSDDDDAEFIAHARSDVPTLLEALARAKSDALDWKAIAGANKVNAEAHVAALCKQIDLADKAAAEGPHENSCASYDRQPCDCWKAEYEAAKEALK